jgi:hypothetical protein
LTIQSLKDSEKKNNRKKGKRYLTGEEKGDILRKLSCRGGPHRQTCHRKLPEKEKKKARKNFKKEVDIRAKEW